MFVSGMGFFTDAYDLFVIGIVVALLKPEWGLSTTQVSLLNSVTLAASAVGAIVFGRIADMLGRKKIYGYEVLILAIGAIASAFAPNYWFLLICRAILGVGIGGDYPVSATIMSEYSGKKSRGRMVGLVFAMQGPACWSGRCWRRACWPRGWPTTPSGGSCSAGAHDRARHLGRGGQDGRLCRGSCSRTCWLRPGGSGTRRSSRRSWPRPACC
ncbi:MAG: MFS transporter [Streptosporangiaceae bacterium]